MIIQRTVINNDPIHVYKSDPRLFSDNTFIDENLNTEEHIDCFENLSHLNVLVINAGEKVMIVHSKYIKRAVPIPLFLVENI